MPLTAEERQKKRDREIAERLTFRLPGEVMVEIVGGQRVKVAQVDFAAKQVDIYMPHGDQLRLETINFSQIVKVC